jgi:hypothetical protein
MNRALLLGLTVLGLAVVCSCGGKTEVAPGSSQGGGAGAAGSVGGSGGNAGSGGQAGHAGVGGSGGGTGGATGSWSYCAGPGWCLEQYNGCCPPCGLEKISDLSGVNRDPAQIDAFRASQCSDPGPDCPNCMTETDPNLMSFCVSAQCQMIDVRTDAISSCTSDGDCVMRYADCCESCGAPNGSLLIAINAMKAGEYSAQVCDPNGGGGCPPCVPTYPPDWSAFCGGDGHCKVAQSQNPAACPSQAPDYNTSCSQPGMHCTWGENPRVYCRKQGDCINGQWIIMPQQTCPPLFGPGQGGCPTYMGAGGQDCAGLEGTVCDMSSVLDPGTLCLCAQCTGGPCTQYGHWWCAPPPAGCPPWAPNVGQACQPPGQFCTYGACGTDVSVGRSCDSAGLWQDDPIACPE